MHQRREMGFSDGASHQMRANGDVFKAQDIPEKGCGDEDSLVGVAPDQKKANLVATLWLGDPLDARQLLDGAAEALEGNLTTGAGDDLCAFNAIMKWLDEIGTSRIEAIGTRFVVQISENEQRGIGPWISAREELVQIGGKRACPEFCARTHQPRDLVGTDVHRPMAKLNFRTQELIGETVGDDYSRMHFGVSASHDHVQ